MFSKLDNFFSAGINNTSCKILNGVCKKAGLDPEFTTYGIKDFGGICRALSSVLEVGLPHSIYKQLDPKIRAQIRDRISTIIYDYICNIPYCDYDPHLPSSEKLGYFFDFEHPKNPSIFCSSNGLYLLMANEREARGAELDAKLFGPLPSWYNYFRVFSKNQIDEITLKSGYTFPKPLNVILPASLLKNADVLFTLLERTFIDIGRMIKSTAPRLFSDNAEQEHEARIYKKSLESFVKGIIDALRYKSVKNDNIELEDYPVIFDVLTKVIANSMNYRSFIDLSEKSKSGTRASIVDRLWALAENYNNYFEWSNNSGESGYSSGTSINRGIQYDRKEGDRYLYSSNGDLGHYSNPNLVRFPKDLFQNEAEMKRELDPEFQQIINVIPQKNAKEVFNKSCLPEGMNGMQEEFQCTQRQPVLMSQPLTPVYIAKSQSDFFQKPSLPNLAGQFDRNILSDREELEMKEMRSDWARLQAKEAQNNLGINKEVKSEPGIRLSGKYYS
jgi:hypothetical protein